MKPSELMLFGLLLIPTLVVAAAAILTFATPDPDPVYRAPAAVVNAAG